MAAKGRATSKTSPREAATDLRRRFKERGYVRMPDLARREEEGSQTYRKGYEVRLPCATRTEANRIAKNLRAVGLKPGKPFAKGSGFAVPIYGKDAVDWFVPHKTRKKKKR